jgi:hypothetical protein
LARRLRSALRHAETFAWKPLRGFWEASFRHGLPRKEDKKRLASAWHDALGDMLLGMLDGERRSSREVADSLGRHRALTAGAAEVPRSRHRRVPELGERCNPGALGGTAPTAATVTRRRRAPHRRVEGLRLPRDRGAAARHRRRKQLAARWRWQGRRDPVAQPVHAVVLPPTLDAIARTVADWPPSGSPRSGPSSQTLRRSRRPGSGRGLAAAGEKGLFPHLHLIEAIRRPRPGSGSPMPIASNGKLIPESKKLFRAC